MLKETGFWNPSEQDPPPLIICSRMHVKDIMSDWRRLIGIFSPFYKNRFFLLFFGGVRL